MEDFFVFKKRKKKKDRNGGLQFVLQNIIFENEASFLVPGLSLNCLINQLPVPLICSGKSEKGKIVFI